jgi:2-polyprenyl-3-methyl-5-hydroxy-6-metoxy-1,4-benzoquinol methylase
MQSTNRAGVRAWRWDNYLDNTLSRYLFRYEYEFVKGALATMARPVRILEVGCGSGRIARPLSAEGYSLVGMDPDGIALTLFQERLDKALLVQGDAVQLPFGDRSYDCVITIEAFQYFTSHQSFFAECSRLLRPNGLVIFQTLNRRNYKRALKRALGRSPMSGLPSGDLSYDDLVRALGAYGFLVENVTGYYWMPFSRFSNNPLVGMTAMVERALGLNRQYRFSPWLLIAARKIGEKG